MRQQPGQNERHGAGNAQPVELGELDGRAVVGQQRIALDQRIDAGAVEHDVFEQVPTSRNPDSGQVGARRVGYLPQPPVQNGGGERQRLLGADHQCIAAGEQQQRLAGEHVPKRAQHRDVIRRRHVVQRQPLDEHAGVAQLVVHLPVVFQGVQHPGFGRGRVGGVRGDRVVAAGGDLEIIASVVADQRPVGAAQHVPVLRAEQGHGVAHVGHDVHRFDRHVVRRHRPQSDAAADRVDQHALRSRLKE